MQDQGEVPCQKTIYWYTESGIEGRLWWYHVSGWETSYRFSRVVVVVEIGRSRDKGLNQKNRDTFDLSYKDVREKTK